MNIELLKDHGLKRCLLAQVTRNYKQKLQKCHKNP